MDEKTNDLANDKAYMLDRTKELIKSKHYYFNEDFALKIVDEIRDSKIDDAVLVEALLVYYRFMMFADTITSLDARADIDVKVTYMYAFEEDIKGGTLTAESDSLHHLKVVTDMCMDSALNPLDLHRESREFYAKHPDVKF